MWGQEIRNAGSLWKDKETDSPLEPPTGTRPAHLGDTVDL